MVKPAPNEVPLLDEVNALARRGIDRVFDTVQRRKPLRLPELFEIVELLHRERWADGNDKKIAAIKSTVRQACDLLPEYPFAPPSEVTFREAALHIFDLELVDPALEGKYLRVGGRYNQLVAILKGKMRRINDDADEITKPARIQLVRNLLDLKEQAVGHAGEGTGTAEQSMKPPDPRVQPVQDAVSSVSAALRADPKRQQNLVNSRLEPALADLAQSLRARYFLEERQWQLSEPSSPLPLHWINGPDELVDHWKYVRGGGISTPNDLSGNWNIVDQYIALPGGVLLTVHPQQSGNSAKSYSLPNIHGDVMATADAAGAQTGTFQYDPFGNQVSSSLPNNTISGTTYGWVGKNQKDTETLFALAPTEMGARVYLSVLGRFTRVDPVAGGTPNSYVYPTDTVNESDLSGAMCLPGSSVFSFMQCKYQSVAQDRARQASSSVSNVTRSAGSAVGGAGAWVGGGLKNAGQKAWSNPAIQGGIIGCGTGILSSLGTAWAVSAGTGGQFELGAGVLLVGCGIGATSGYLNAVRPGAGAGVDAAGAAKDAYDIYTRYPY